MIESVNYSKFKVPTKQKGFLHRSRLIDQMHESIYRKLTFVSAPAGYGKTSLLADFASDLDARICWYLLTQGDEDLRRFAWNLLVAIRSTFPEFGAGIESQLRTTPGGLDPVNLAIDFINAAMDGIDDFCVLFIDDYHLVAESEEVTGFLEAFLDYLPEGLRLVIASRTEFGIPTGKLYIRNQMSLMNIDLLRFRADELQQLIRRMYRVTLSDEDAGKLAKESDGWVFAAMLAARSFEAGQYLEFKGEPQHAYEFLAGDVFAKESAKLQRFMLSVSIVDVFDLPLAELLYGSSNAAGLIQELEQRNLFIARVDTVDGSAYRFHQLFLEFLRLRLKKIDPLREQELHLHAAGWYEENRPWEQAIYHYLKVGNRLAAARLMDRIAKDQFVFGENARVEEWLNILSEPPDMRAEAPQLILNRAKFLVDQNRLEEAGPLLDIAEEVFRADEDEDKILNSLSVRGLIQWRRREFEEALATVSSAREILARADEAALYPGRALQFDRIEALCFLLQGNREAGVPALRRVIENLRTLLKEVTEDVIQVQIAHDLVQSNESLGLYSYQTGSIYQGQNNFLEAYEIRKQYLHNNQGLVYSLNNIGYIYFQLGEFEKAYQHLSHGIQLAVTIGKGQATIYIYNSYGDLMRTLDEWDAAEKSLQTALGIGESASVSRKQLDTSGTYTALMMLERVRGNYDRAIYHLHESYRLRQLSPDSPDFSSALGAIYFDMGQIDLAIETFLKAVDGYGEAGVATQHCATAYFLLAASLYRQNRRAEALDWLKTSLGLTARMGYDQFLVSEARRSHAFLRFASEGMPDSVQVKSLLKRAENFSTGIAQFERGSVQVEEPVETIWVEAYGFGAGRVKINGHWVEKSAWRANMARALFFYILDGGGDTGNNIKLNFWPDKSGPKATSNFQSTLWRARNALEGLNIIILESNQYRISPAVHMWYDVAEFESRLQLAEDPNIGDSERIDLWSSALDLVDGDFLDDVYMDWASDRRIQLQRQIQETLEKMGAIAYAKEKFQEAETYFERLMQVDPYRDDILLAILKCWIGAGAPAQARKRYRNYMKFLSREGLFPSRELELFSQSLSRK